MKTAASKRNYLLSIEFFSSLSLITRLLKNSTLKTQQTRYKTCIRHTVLVNMNMPIENAPRKNNTKIILGMELQIKEKDNNLIGKLFRKDKRCLLTLDFKPFRS